MEPHARQHLHVVVAPTDVLNRSGILRCDCAHAGGVTEILEAEEVDRRLEQPVDERAQHAAADRAEKEARLNRDKQHTRRDSANAQYEDQAGNSSSASTHTHCLHNDCCLSRILPCCISCMYGTIWLLVTWWLLAVIH